MPQRNPSGVRIDASKENEKTQDGKSVGSGLSPFYTHSILCVYYNI